MKKVLATIGIGNASVDTVLPSTTVRPGESVEAEVRMQGGNAEQDVSRIELEVETRFLTDDGYRDGTVGRMHLSDGFTLDPDEERVETTTIEVPWDTPVTVGSVDVWVETELDVTGVDPEDVDYLDVQPTARLQAVFDALEELGLSLYQSECSRDPYSRYGGGIVQEFEFRPSGGPFAGDLDELEVVARESAEELVVYLEVDRRGGLLSEMADTDESHTSLTVTSTDPTVVREDLRRVVEKYV
ncbi:sporulation protein [Salinirubellus salinus]|jgi:sporulation-control protein|uniref:Sporulation protein n=1 Tax=Salinirubellus salinus TaxID=1364945 RepID=A0A9E7R3U2_9EURY|nr:sporulation protein [Salinirubellus salinus]UWM54160.1 sporulation protein [Salinirubellus salinus]